MPIKFGLYFTLLLVIIKGRGKVINISFILNFLTRDLVSSFIILELYFQSKTYSARVRKRKKGKISKKNKN